ncbi:MAG: RecX family transcriptional regulator [Oscillospiraceae bacterium]|nr:RecX family transcriptional regulator [Oscillospiraceae bacterium]
MIEVLSTRMCDGGDGISLLISNDGVKNKYTVSADFFIENQVAKGFIDEDLFDYIVQESNNYAAKRAAIRIITNGQCSKDKLYKKLRARGFSHECAKNASDFVDSKNYIDEEWQIENYLKTLVEKKNFGKRKVFALLLAKGYKSEDIARIVDAKYSDSDFKKYRSEFLISRFGKSAPETREEAEEFRKELYKNGY